MPDEVTIDELFSRATTCSEDEFKRIIAHFRENRKLFKLKKKEPKEKKSTEKQPLPELEL